MGIIDEKGRLFGKINVIDFFVILILVFLMPTFYFGYKLFTKDQPVLLERESFEIEIDGRFIKLTSELLDIISVGDKEFDNDGRVIAEIVKLGEVGPYIHEFNFGSNEKQSKEDPILKQIPVRLRLKVEIQRQDIFFKDEHITFETPIDFKTEKYSIIALLKSTRKGWLRTQVKFTGVIPELSNIIREGDVENDANGEAVAVLTKIISNNPSDVLILQEDNFMSLNHPFHKDIIAEIDVLYLERDKVYYFKNYPIKIGNSIVFSPEIYSLSGTIIGLGIN